MIGGTDQSANSGFLHAEFFEKFFCFIRGEIDEVALDLGADNHGFAGEMCFDVFADLQDKRILISGLEVRLFDITGKDGGLVREQIKMAGNGFFLWSEGGSDGGLSGVEAGLQFGQDGVLGEGFLVTALGILGDAGSLFLNGFEVCEHEFSVDRLDIADRFDVAGDVMNIRILETTDDLDNSVHLANMCEKLVPQTFSGTGTFNKAGNIDEFNRRRNDDGGFGDVFEDLEARVRPGDNADVRIDGAEGIVCRFRLARARNGVEQGGFSNVRQTNNASFQHKG